MAFRALQDPQGMLENLQDEMNRVFDRVWHGGLSTGPFDGQSWAPMLDMYEYADRYMILVELPGVDPKTVDVTHVGNTLTIRGERSNPVEGTEYDRAPRRERRFGTFCRSLDLPEDIEADKLAAKCRDGVLEIVVPKPKANVPKTVKIDVQGG